MYQESDPPEVSQSEKQLKEPYQPLLSLCLSMQKNSSTSPAVNKIVTSQKTGFNIRLLTTLAFHVDLLHPVEQGCSTKRQGTGQHATLFIHVSVEKFLQFSHKSAKI